MLKLTDVAYGTHERQRFDICLPDEKTHGLILFIHGGGWVAGDKNWYGDELTACSAKGYAAAAMNYHYLSPDVRMDTLIRDISEALERIKAVSGEHGFDLDRVLLTGASAGGHLSLLYAYSMAESAPIRPVCVVDYCGPAMLTDDKLLYETPVKNPPAEQWINIYTWLTGVKFDESNIDRVLPELERYSPVSYVKESSVPTIICHGQKDAIVPFSNAVALRDKLEACGVEYIFLPLPDAGHGLEQKEIFEESKVLFGMYAERFLK